MEAAVEDYFETDTTEDLVLLRLISITSKAINGGQLFQNPMQETVLWANYFRGWVAKGLEEQGEILRRQEELVQKNMGVPTE